jgi:hypothetical protein
MKCNQIIAGVSAAAVLAMVTPAYAGLFGGGTGTLGGSMTTGVGGMTGQGAFGGRGAASTSFDRVPERSAPRAKPATTGIESAQRSGGGATKALSASAAHEADGSAVTKLGQASGETSSTANAAVQSAPRAAATAASSTASAAGSPPTPTPTTTAPVPASKATPSSSAASPSAPPAAMTSAAGAGSIDAQHSRGDNSVAVSGEASGSDSRTL